MHYFNALLVKTSNFLQLNCKNWLDPWLLFNSYEEQNNHIGKAEQKLGWLFKNLLNTFALARRDLQNQEITVSHWDNQGKIAAARSGWDIRYFNLNCSYECFEIKKGRRTSSIFYTAQIFPRLVLYMKSCRSCKAGIQILNIKSLIKSHVSLAMGSQNTNKEWSGFASKQFFSRSLCMCILISLLGLLQLYKLTCGSEQADSWIEQMLIVDTKIQDIIIQPLF